MKKNILQRIERKLFRKVLDKSECKNNFIYDFNTYFANCLDGNNGKDQILSHVMLSVHQLEKVCLLQSLHEFLVRKKLCP